MTGIKTTSNRFFIVFFGLIFSGFLIQPLYAQTAGTMVKEAIVPESALKHYIDLEDDTFSWEVMDSSSIGNITLYHLLLTSQQWREHLWQHQLTLFIPPAIKEDGALLFITGGSNQHGGPKWIQEDGMWPAMAAIAEKNQAVVSILRQTPNQPLFHGKTEDELISFTLHNFREDGDYSWPLLFPMVKSAVMAMDAVQEFSEQNLDQEVRNFVISGASKRGWTTWLSAAIGDERIKAIAPMVIDVLNMPVNLQYQLDSYGSYSEQIQDYVNLGIVQSMATPEGKALVSMIDPYSYRAKLKVPKIIFMGTNDEYWTVDAVKHYYSGIPGLNMLHYVPNAGHNLGGGEQALQALDSFFALTLQDGNYPVSAWKIISNDSTSLLTIRLEDPDVEEAVLWYAKSTDRDFRDEKWESKSLGQPNASQFEIKETHPQEGFKAFYVDLVYKDPHGDPFSVSTRMYVLDAEGVK